MAIASTSTFQVAYSTAVTTASATDTAATFTADGSLQKFVITGEGAELAGNLTKNQRFDYDGTGTLDSNVAVSQSATSSFTLPFINRGFYFLLWDVLGNDPKEGHQAFTTTNYFTTKALSEAERTDTNNTRLIRVIRRVGTGTTEPAFFSNLDEGGIVCLNISALHTATGGAVTPAAGFVTAMTERRFIVRRKWNDGTDDVLDLEIIAESVDSSGELTRANIDGAGEGVRTVVTGSSDLQNTAYRIVGGYGFYLYARHSTSLRKRTYAGVFSFDGTNTTRSAFGSTSHVDHRLVRNATPTQMTFSFPDEGEISISATLQGTLFSRSTTTPPVPSGSTATDVVLSSILNENRAKASGTGGSAVYINDTYAQNATTENLSMELNRNLGLRRDLGQLTPARVIAGAFTASMNFVTVEYEDSELITLSNSDDLASFSVLQGFKADDTRLNSNTERTGITRNRLMYITMPSASINAVTRPLRESDAIDAQVTVSGIAGRSVDRSVSANIARKQPRIVGKSYQISFA